MTQATENIVQRPAAAEVRQQLAGKHVCPFCGVIRADPNQPCPRCTMEDTTATRTATRQRIGPWFVLQARNPSAPGMKFFTLLSLVKKGHVTPRSIVRGPTTQQLWTFASRVRGLSREFGLCWHCGEGVEATAVSCSHCDRPLDPPSDPDVLLEADSNHTPTSSTPELTLSAATNPDTGMDGGASLDLQADHAFGSIGATTPAPRSPRTARPSVTSPMTSSTAIAARPAVALPAKPAAASEEAILSAKELAAAFQLDFKPPPNSRGSVVETKVLAPRAASAPKRFGPFKTLVILIVIAAAAVAIVLTLRQDLRDRSVAWVNATWASIKTSLDAPANRPVAPPEHNKPAPNSTPTVVQNPDPTPKPEPRIETQNPEPVRPPVEVAKVDPPAPIPAPTPKPEPKIDTPKPEPVRPPVNVPEVDPNVDIDQAIAIAQQLRKNAIDAEGHDWAGALRLYEQIQKLPQEAWPTDLQIRINRVKANLK